MLIHAVVCPQPPLLVPALAPGASPDVVRLREMCADVVAGLANSGCEQIIVVAGAGSAGRWDERSGGSLAAYGVNVAYGGEQSALPASLTIGAFLLDQAGWSGRRHYVAVPSNASPRDCVRIGRRLAALPDQIGLLVLGDGSAKRTDTAPGYLDARADSHDIAVSRALDTADCDALLFLDPRLAEELWVAGRAAWQVLAAATQASLTDETTVAAQVRYDEVPLGVGYLVAVWCLTT